jgi:hypothetical protein
MKIMIYIDKEKQQILSNSCLNCQDDSFQRANSSLPVIGCCSYSPTFHLLEIANMSVKDPEFLKEFVLKHAKAEIFPYSVKVHASIHSDYKNVDLKLLTKLEEEDLRLSYSTCQYFHQGCTLDSTFKNIVCRTFICLTIEDALNKQEKNELNYWTKTFHKRERDFQKLHEGELKKRGIDLVNNPLEVINYFQALNKFF